MSIKKVLIGTLAIAALGFSLPADKAHAAGDAPKPPAQDWSFGGLFGTVDKASAQRGFQVYKEVCAGCHGLTYIHFRNLEGIGFTEDEVKAIAAEYEVEDGPDDEGEMFARPARPADRWPAPYPNDNAARAGNNGALPPELSLIVEARGIGTAGSDYIYGLLVGYTDPPSGESVSEGMSYNTYFPGHQIAMPPPLFEDGVEYADGTAATIAQQAMDVTTFLSWASEPNIDERKRTGVMVIIYLILLSALFYAAKRRVWAKIH